MGDVLVRLLLRSTDLDPGELAGALNDAAVALGARSSTVLIADLDQQILRELPPTAHDIAVEAPVDGSFAGQAYRTEQVVVDPDHGTDGRWLWVPLMDSAQRLGVLGVEDDGSVPMEWWLALCNLAGELLVSNLSYGDALELARRSEDVTLAAEMRWALLPPLTFSSARVHVSGILQPGHEIAGDAFDYGIDGSVLSIAVLDAMGHGLEASRIANLAVGAYRNRRRRGATTSEALEAMDRVVSESYADRFVTGQLATLDLDHGDLAVLNAGHPRPLLFRPGRPPEELPCRPCLPVGLGSVPLAESNNRLEPGDVVVFYTDGITEAKGSAGDFGVERLQDRLTALLAEGLPPAEILRRVVVEVTDHQDGSRSDDATLVLLRWNGPGSPS